MIEKQTYPRKERKTMQVSIRLISLLLLFFLVTGRFSTAHPYKGGNVAARGYNIVSHGKPFLNEVFTTISTRENMPGGRKMLLDNAKRLEKIKGNTGASEGVLKITGTTQNVGEGVDLNVGQQRFRNLLSEGIDVPAAFVAFSADYHGPKHHPPKNN